LLSVPDKELLSQLSPEVAWGIINMRAGKVYKEPGYDGEYGVIKILPPEEGNQKKEQQLSLF